MGSRIRDNVRHLVECFCEVSSGGDSKEPYILIKYPDSYKNEEELKSLPKFTFPCAFENSVVQHFSFVLTSVDSKYTFCFCRHDPKTATALVLMSHLPWHDIFYKVLNCIASLINEGKRSQLPSFLEACRMKPPMPGDALHLSYNDGNDEFIGRCPDLQLPSIPENCNLTEYYSAVDTRCMSGLWAALLSERHVAVVASKPSRLSATVQAANATLYPMSWQHIFIPVLPAHLVDYLLAPMPFLVGVPRVVMEGVRLSDIGDVVILDADANELHTPFDDLESLPFEVVTSLKRALRDKNSLNGDAISRAFLRALVRLIGGYRDAIRIEKGKKITFNPEAFVKTRRISMQPFLKKILQLQIFQQFIEERLDLLNSGRGFSDEFELECGFYAERGRVGGDRGHRIKQQYHEWASTVRREGGALLKTVKDKANPAVKSAVKSVRQGGRGMKKAVKGIKSLGMRDGSNAHHGLSPRPSSANNGRLSYSSTPACSSSSSSMESDPTLRSSPPLHNLDLLYEMNSMFYHDAVNRSASSVSIPESSLFHLDANSLDKAKTLSPRVAPRPSAPARYPVVATRQLLDLSDAPPPPPRSATATRPATAGPTLITATRPSTVAPTLTTATRTGTVAPTRHNQTVRFTTDSGGSLAVSRKPSIDVTSSSRLPPPPPPPDQSQTQATQKVDTVSDLIQLDVSDPRCSTKLEDFDPIRKGKSPTVVERAAVSPSVNEVKRSADSALLQEYGLDFSKFGLEQSDSFFSATHAAVAPQGSWTTF